jgi:hypothetical protein
MRLPLTITFLLCTHFFINAQSVKPYLTIIKTSNGIQKGVLYKADSNTIVIDENNELITVKMSDTKWVKIRMMKDDYRIKSFVKKMEDPYDESNYEKRQGDVPIRKLDKPIPTVSERINAGIVRVSLNFIANLFALSIHAINPAIDRFKRKENKFTTEQIEELSYYSIIYQSTPHDLKSLQPVKSDH